MSARPPSHLHPVQAHWPTPPRYVAAASISEAVALLGGAPAGSARLVAGGSDLLLELQRGVRRDISTLIDISRAADGRRIDVVSESAVAHLGPLVTHSDVIAATELRAGAMPLAQACYEVGSPQLRNRATVVGNIVTASPANDTISALLALGASVTLTSAVRGARTMTVDDLITGFRTTQLADDEMITDLAVPLTGPRERGVYVKLGNRSAQAISVVHLAVVVGFEADDRTVATVRMAIGSVAPTVVLLPEVAALLAGRVLDDAAIHAAATAAAALVRPIADVRATAEYRTSTVEVVIRRALRALAADRQGERWPAAPPSLSNRLAPVPPATRSITTADSVTATINGRQITAAGAVGTTLLDWLRAPVGLTGTKEGCAEGECGACTVILDGDAVMSCLVPAARADGATITTIEGLAEGDVLHPLQAAFVQCGAVQCGYCTPGFIVAGAALLDEVAAPSREQIRQGLAGNLCRCTGYASIIAAMELAAAKATT